MMAWSSPSLQLRWGPYFKPDPAEQKQVVDMVRAALSGDGGGLITKRHAVEKIAAIFGIENVDAALDEIEKEDEERQEKALQQTTSELETAHSIAAKFDGGNGAGPGAKGGAKPPQAPGV